MKAIPILSALFAILIFASDSYGCRCSLLADLGKSEKTLVEEAKKKADAVFIGEIVEIRFSESGENVEPFIRYAKFKVQKSWKGVEDDYIEISTTNICCICGVDFQKGQKYFIYAKKHDSGEYSTSICTRTQMYHEGNVDEKYLGEPAKIKSEEKNWFNPENVSAPVPIVFGLPNDGYPETIKVRGFIRDLTFAKSSCGIFSFSGTLRVQLSQNIESYKDDNVFIVISCFGDDEKYSRLAELYLHKEIELTVHKLHQNKSSAEECENPTKPCHLGFISNKINSNGIPFYFTRSEHSEIFKFITQ